MVGYFSVAVIGHYEEKQPVEYRACFCIRLQRIRVHDHRNSMATAARARSLEGARLHRAEGQLDVGRGLNLQSSLPSDVLPPARLHLPVISPNRTTSQGPSSKCLSLWTMSHSKHCGTPLRLPFCPFSLLRWPDALPSP